MNKTHFLYTSNIIDSINCPSCNIKMINVQSYGGEIAHMCDICHDVVWELRLLDKGYTVKV